MSKIRKDVEVEIEEPYPWEAGDGASDYELSVYRVYHPSLNIVKEFQNVVSFSRYITWITGKVMKHKINYVEADGRMIEVGLTT